MRDYFFNAPLRVGGGQEEGAIVVLLAELPQAEQNIVFNTNLSFFSSGHADPAKVLVRINNFGNEVRVSLLVPKGIGNETGFGDTGISLGVGLCPDACALPLHHEKLPEIVKKLGNQAPPAWKQLAAFQQSRVWPNDAPRVPRSADTSYQGINRADLLDWLAEQAGMDFLADFYAQPSLPMSADRKSHSFTADPKTELDLIARDQDISWRHTDTGLYLFRNNRWYRDDRLEIPAEWRQRWLKQMVALKVDPPPHPKDTDVPEEDPAHFRACLDWAADIASKLTDWQLATGFAWTAMERPVTSSAPNHVIDSDALTTLTLTASVQQPPERKEMVYPFMAIAEVIQNELSTLRLYASLSDANRTALMAGRLPLSALSLAQQQQVLYLTPTQILLAGDQRVGLRAQPQHQGYGLMSGWLALPFPWNNLRLAVIPAQ